METIIQFPSMRGHSALAVQTKVLKEELADRLGEIDLVLYEQREGRFLPATDAGIDEEIANLALLRLPGGC